MGVRENRAYTERPYFFLVLSRSERILCLWASASRWQRLYFFPLPHQQMSFRPVSAFSVSGTLLPLNKRSSSFTMLQSFLQYPNAEKSIKKPQVLFAPCGCLFRKSQLTLYRLIISRFHVKLFACKCSFILWRTSPGRRIPLLLGQACKPPDLWPGKRGAGVLGAGSGPRFQVSPEPLSARLSGCGCVLRYWARTSAQVVTDHSFWNKASTADFAF